ncbi:MAG: 6-phosphofructokinase [Dehalococcoidia bacterium]|nr:6-phosphofructokinase [Dehalococcoidia bacterium]
MKRIAVLGSGGDSPGMNACVRAVVRRALRHGLEPFGVYDGYGGLIEGRVRRLSRRSVSNIIQRGGIFLGAGRSEEFRLPEGRAKAAAVIRQNRIDGLVALGGDGTLLGAMAFTGEWEVPTVVIPATIDNDMAGTDIAIGFDTAVNTAVEAVDRIRDTAEATERVFFVEVMGRASGAIALEVGIASGADAILVPEVASDTEKLLERLKSARARRARSILVVVAEGDVAGGAFAIAQRVQPQLERESRVTVLGHVQRGGRPTATDRVLATKLGVSAVDALIEGKRDLIVGQVKDEICLTPFSQVKDVKRKIPLDYLQVAVELA